MDKIKLGLEILKTLETHGFQAYIVGGAVRDYVRKTPVQDVDITTSALPAQIAEIFSDVTMEGEEFYSCRIHLDGQSFEITTFRKDISYEDHRHPVTIPALSLEEDLARRDFTMNALLMDSSGDILDFYYGIEDIQNGIIHMIGDPEKRFEEDALRVLRALDFASRWNYQLEESILEAFQKDYLSYLKEEYIIGMLKKIIENPYTIGLKMIVEYQLLRAFPFYQVVCEEILQFQYKRYAYALFYARHHFLPWNCKISNKERKEAKEIAYFVQHSFSKLSLYYGNIDRLEEAIKLYNALYKKEVCFSDILKEYQRLPIHSAKEIKLDWNQIPNLSRSRMTKKIEEAILLGKIANEEEQIKKYIEIEE